jgi:uncharacterized protein YjbJ (UPF0337 family)
MRSKAKSIKSSVQDEIEGRARIAAGIIKEETGKALKNAQLVSEGAFDQFVGTAQRNIGRIKDALGS